MKKISEFEKRTISEDIGGAFLTPQEKKAAKNLLRDLERVNQSLDALSRMRDRDAKRYVTDMSRKLKALNKAAQSLKLKVDM